MAPYSSAGAKNEIADDGHFYKKNSFRSFYKKTPSVPRLFWNVLVPGLTGTRTFQNN